MDIGTLRGLGTVVIMVAFIGLVIWAYSGKRKKSFDEATMLPFADDPEEGLMWRAVNEDGTLTYSFVEALAAGHPGFIVRMLGGFIFLLGMFLMAYNTWRTVSAAKPAEYEAAAQIA